MSLKRLLVSGTAAIAAVAVFGAVAMAASQPRTVILPKSQTVNHDYYVYGGTVDVAGTVNGDVYAAGGQVTVDGTVNGDVLAVGGTLTISGQVNGNVRAAGGQITINGTVVRNVTLAGGNLEVGSSGNINGNVVAASGTLLVAGGIKGDLRAAGGTMTLTGPIGGNVDVADSQLTVGSGAVIGGHLTYLSQANASIDSGAQTGPVTHSLPSQNQPTRLTRPSGLWTRLYWLVEMVLIGALLLLLVPNYTQAVASSIQTKPWIALGLGFAGLILAPIAAVILLVTIIGAPIGLALMMRYIGALLLSHIWVALLTGQLAAKALKTSSNVYLALLVGAVVLTLVSWIPFLGPLVSFVVLLFGLGGFIYGTSKLFRSLRQEAKI